MKTKIIIDTDPGCDDAMAILMLLAQKQIDIMALTTVAGNSNISNVTKNAKFVLDLTKQKNIPIFSGSTKPLKRKLILADVQGPTGLANINTRSTKTKLTGNAVEKIIKLVMENPKKVSILAIGPLTNIARAINTEPKIKNIIKEIIIMGGAINVPGNKSRVAEFNFFVDPEAAKIVMESAIKIILIPIDLCNKIYLTSREISKLTNGKIGKTLSSILEPYMENIAKFDGLRGAVMYDPLAAYYLINPAAFSLKPMDIKIETKGELTAGMAVTEQRKKIKRINNVQVAISVNRRQFTIDLIKAINKLDGQKYLIFDMDGTIYQLEKEIKSSVLMQEVRNKAIGFISRKLALNTKQAKKIYLNTFSKYHGSVSIGMEKDYGIDRFEYFKNAWDIEAKIILEPNPQIKTLLSNLSRMYSFILLSDAPRIWIDKVLQFYSLTDIFKKRIFSGESDIRKEFGNAFDKILGKFSGIASNFVSIGDQEETDILPAKKLGMKTILIGNRKCSADICIQNLSKLKQALERIKP